MSETTYEKTSTKTETTFRLHGAPDVELQYTTIPIRPDVATVTDVNGNVARVEVRGGRVLKSGKVSDLSRHDVVWHGYGGEWPDGTPEFVLALVHEVMRRA